MIRKIYHVSDIHIRNFKRHDEYKKVFNKLYFYLKQNFTSQDLICLTGDIVHSKTDVTPELIEEVQLFLKSLADIGRVLLIPGNHDANLNNSHRLDSLTPIVNALNHPNLVYVKDTKTFQILETTFCHWSVFDSPSNYIKASELDNYFDNNELKICLYHGPVAGTLTEFGFSLFHNDIKVEDFEGFDLVLLGDIHKTQFLNESNTIGYPGSLIQQNHGEGLTHGIFVWDIEKRSAEFVEIKNDTAFYTLEVDTGIYEPLPKELPKNLYLRIKYKNTPQSEIKKIVAEIKQEYNVIETSLIRIKEATNYNSNNKNLSLLDVRNLDYQNFILAEYLKQTLELDDQIVKEISEINKGLNAKLAKSEVVRNAIWIPKTFEFSDMFSYGKDNFIDFSKMQGVYGIFAPNASGKSTLLESLTYCIFDKCTRTGKASQVMNSKSKTFHCKLVFEMNGIEYTIERKGETQKYGNVRVNVDFYYIDESGQKVSLNGKERSDTNKNITSVLGNYEDFILTTISVQGNNTGFIDMNQKDRKDLLSQFLDINIFEDLYNLANNEMKEVSVLLKEYQKDNYYELLKESNTKIDKLEKSLASSNQELRKIESKRDKKNLEILDEAKNLTKIEEVEDIEDLEEQKNKVILAKEQINNIANNTEKEIKDKIEVKESLEASIKALNAEEIDYKLTLLAQKKQEKNKKAVENASLKANLDSMKVKLDQLKDLKYDPSCKFCMENVFVKDAIEIKKSFPEQEKLVKDSNLEIETINKVIEELNKFETKKKDLDKKVKELQSLDKDLDRLKLELTKLDHKNKQSKTLMESIDYKINLYKKQQEAIEKNKTINSKIVNLNKELDNINKELKDQNDIHTDIVANKKLEENNKIKWETNIEKTKDLEVKFRQYQYYLQAIHRDGLPHKLISNIVPTIEEEINNILAPLVDFSIVIQADDKNINAFIAYDDTNYWPIELSSGMEKFISSLAIRTSLINISTLPRPNFIAIDEGFGALDQSNLSSIVMLFDYLKTQFKFIKIISHIETMRDIVDHHIEINKVGGKSKIEQVD